MPKVDFVSSFPAYSGCVGYEQSGRVVAENLSQVDDFDPIAQAISQIIAPQALFAAIQSAQQGSKSSVGYIISNNDQGIEVTNAGISAFFNLGDEEFVAEMTFAQFDPILAAWQKAWSAALEYRKLHKV